MAQKSHSSLFGHWFPCSGRKHKDFAQSSQLINPTQSPTLAFMGFRWIFASLKGKYIFGQSTLFWIYAFISVFSKSGGIWNKDITKHMRKRI
jgi:hypothetical protein